MATSRKGATAPVSAAPAAQAIQPSVNIDWRDRLEHIDSCTRALEGLAEIITPYTSAEGARGTLLRNDVAWPLGALVHALRDAVDAGWILSEGGRP